MDGIQIPSEFHQWAMKWIQIENKKESKVRNQIITNHQENYKKCLKKIDNLIDMRSSEDITKEEFLRKKLELSEERIRLEELAVDTGDRINKQIEKAEEVFLFAEKAKDRFQNGDIENKKEILTALGSNLILKDKKLSITIQKPLFLIEKVARQVKAINQRLEPLKNRITNNELEKIYLQNPTLLRG